MSEEELAAVQEDAEPRTGPNSLTFFPVSGSFYAVADPSVSGTISDPQIQPVDALVTFTPRLPVGFQAFVDDYLISPAYNAQQTISIIGNAVQGTWQLTSPLASDETTSVLQFNATPSQVQTALTALPSIGAGNLVVTAGINPQSYNIDFTGALGELEILPLIPTWTDLTDANGYQCTITVVTTATGSPQITGPTSISIPPRSARIWSGVLSTIDYVDTAGIQLTAETAILNLPDYLSPLIYDVAFSHVTFNSANQVLGNFAFQASADATPICITDPDTEKLNYQRPISTVWQPIPTDPSIVGPGVAVMSDWRRRAADQPAAARLG